MTHWIFLFSLVLILSASPARGEDARCQEVRTAVASYGPTLALAWARTNGYSEDNIRQARRCLVVPEKKFRRR